MMRRSWLILSLLSLVILAGCSLLVGSEPMTPPPPVTEPEEYVFEDDFTGDEVGEAPSKWTLNNYISEHGFVKVVEDDGVPSGRAAHFRANKNETRYSLQMGTQPFGELAADAKTLAIEYWVNYVEGGAIYHYITASSVHRMMFLRTGGNILNNRENHGGDSNVSVPIAELKEGWNQIRVIADKDSGRVIFYVNDMENPIPNEFQILAPIESWDILRFTITHETSSSEFREAYYSGFKVWVVE